MRTEVLKKALSIAANVQKHRDWVVRGETEEQKWGRGEVQLKLQLIVQIASGSAKQPW